jgi:hypothetical protein
VQDELTTAPAPAGCPAHPTRGERLVLAGLRAWGHARLSGPLPQGVVRPALSFCASERVATLFTAFMEAVEVAALRPIEIQCLHCNGLSLDEQRLVVACGIAPVAFDLGRKVLEPMLRDTETPLVLARCLNGALAAEGLFLPARLMDGPALHGDTPPRTLH